MMIGRCQNPQAFLKKSLAKNFKLPTANKN